MTIAEVAGDNAGERKRRVVRLAAFFGARVSVQSLAVFRIAFGALLVWDCYRFVRDDRIYRYYVEPEFNFPYAGFEWITPLPEPWIHYAWLGVGVAGFLVAIGLFYRVAIVALTILFSYFFLLDKAEYLNHFYLVILFALLLCVLPANRAYSVDARLLPGVAGDTVPYAAVFVLRAQMEIMLIAAGVVKLTPDWLAGQPLGLWLRNDGWSPLSSLFAYDGFIVAAAWGTVLLHLLGAPLLLWRRTRLPVFLTYCVFHMANAHYFNIGIFPWMTIAATTIFFAPDWPRQFARWLLGRFEDLPPAERPAPAGRPRPVPALALGAIAAFLAVQVALPARSVFYGDEVRWTGDGHRFSWRMRIYDRLADGRFVVSMPGPEGRRWVVDPRDVLTDDQTDVMLGRPDLVHQFARHLEERWRADGHGDVEVRAEIRKSLNGRPFQTYIDPSVDLTDVALNQFGPDPWVLPIEEPVWGVGDPIASLPEGEGDGAD